MCPSLSAKRIPPVRTRGTPPVRTQGTARLPDPEAMQVLNQATPRWPTLGAPASRRLLIAVALFVVLQVVPGLVPSLSPLAVSVHAKIASPDFTAGWKANLAEGERLLKTKEYARAELCFRKACDEVKRAVPRSADDEALCMLSLARVLYKQDLIVETVPLYKKIIRTLGKAHGKRTVKVVVPLVEMADILEYEGDYKKAAKNYTRAIDITAETSGTQSLAYADYQHRLGRTRVKQGLLKDGEELYLIALDVAMKQPKLPSSDFLDECLSDYITLLFKTDDRAKSLQSHLQNELLKDRVGLTRKRGIPPSNFSTAVSVQLADKAGAEAATRSQSLPPIDTNAGVTGGDQQVGTPIAPDQSFSDFAALEKINQQRISFYERMIATDIDSLGPDHPSVARDLGGLASIYIQQRKYDEAKPLLERALAIYRKSYQGNAAPVRQTEFLLQLISEEQRPGSVQIDMSYATDLPKIPLQAQTLEVALRLSDVAFMLYCQGKIDTSLKVYYWAMASTAGATGETSLLAAANMADMSRLLRLRGRASEAEKLESNAQAIVRRDLLDKRSRLLP